MTLSMSFWCILLFFFFFFFRGNLLYTYLHIYYGSRFWSFFQICHHGTLNTFSCHFDVNFTLQQIIWFFFYGCSSFRSAIMAPLIHFDFNSKLLSLKKKLMFFSFRSAIMAPSIHSYVILTSNLLLILNDTKVTINTNQDDFTGNMVSGRYPR